MLFFNGGILLILGALYSCFIGCFTIAYPMIVTVIAILTKQERLSRFKLFGLMLSTFGLALVLGVAMKDINLFGVALALGSALFYATYVIIGNHVLQTTTPLVTITVISTSAALTYGVIGLTVSGATWNLAWNTWLGIGGIAFFSTIVAMLTFFHGMKQIGAISASIISTLEPVLTVLIAVILLDEQLTLLQGVGGVFVVLGGILAVLSPALSVLQPEFGDIYFQSLIGHGLQPLAQKL